MKQKNTRHKTTAVEFIRSQEQTMNLMESIGNDTIREHKAMFEASFGGNTESDEDGIFNMDNLLDVDSYDREEQGVRKEPEIWSAPVDELTENDHGQIIEELAKQFMNMKDDVIDINQIGPIATVIQSNLGLRQNLEEYISNIITGASDRQDSQSFAHGWKDAQENSIPGGDAPTDIAPTKVGVDGEGSEVSELSVEPIEGAIDIDRPQDNMEMPLDGGIDLGGEGLEGEELEGEGLEGEGLEGEGLEGEGLEGEDDDDIDLTGEDDLASTLNEDDSALDLDSQSDDNVQLEEDEEDEEDFKPKFAPKDVDAQLESIARQYKNSSVDAQLESLRNELIGKKEALVESTVDPLKAKLESIANEYKATIDAKESEVKVKARLESIADAYFNKVEAKKSIAMVESIRENYLEQKKVESKQKLEKTLTGLVESYHKSEVQKKKSILEAKSKNESMKAKLESIAAQYKATESKVVVESKQDSDIDKKLTTLVESYHKNVTPTRESIRNRFKQLQD